MPNDYENPKYTNKNEYHAGDGPFQFPWWAIVIAFVVWWPLGLVFIGLNAAMKNGRLGGFEQKAREATRDRTASGAKPVYTAEFRPIYDTPAQPQPKAAAPHAAPQQAQVRAAGKKLKGAALATGLTVAGVLLLLCALAALPRRHLLAARGPDGGRQLLDLAGRGFDADADVADRRHRLPVRCQSHPHHPPYAQENRQYRR